MRILEQKQKPSGWKLLRKKFIKNGKESDVKKELENAEATSTSSGNDFSRNKTPSRLARAKAMTPGRFKRSGGGTESLLQKSERESEPTADDPNAEQRDPDTDLMSPSELTLGPRSVDRVSSSSGKILHDRSTFSTVITVMSTRSTPKVDGEAFPTLSSASIPSPKLVADFDPWEDDKSTSSEKPWKSFFGEDPFPHDEPSTLARPDPSQAGSKPSTLAGSNPSQGPPAGTRSESSSLAGSHLSPQVLPTWTRNKPSIHARSESSPQDLPTGTRSKPSTLARSDRQALPAGKTITSQVFRSKHSTRITIHAPSVLEESLTTLTEDTSELESFPKTQAVSNRNNAAVTKAEECKSETSTIASLPMYSPDLWEKVEEENDIEKWDPASPKASVAVKAPMQAEEKSKSNDSSKAEVSPTRLQTKAIMRKKSKAFMRRKSTNKQHSLFNDSSELTSSEKKNSVYVSVAQDTMVQDDANMLTTSETKSNISVAEEIFSDVDDGDAVIQDDSTGLALSESKSFSATSVAENILAGDLTETEDMHDDLELMLSESKRVGAILLAEETLSYELMKVDVEVTLSESKSFGAISVAEGILADDLTETDPMQNDSAELKLSDSKSFSANSVPETIVAVDLTDTEVVHDDSAELRISESKSFGAISVAEGIYADDLTVTDATQNDSAELKLSDSKSFGANSEPEKILAVDLTDTKVVYDDSTEPLVPPMSHVSPSSPSLSSQSDSERSLQKKAIAAAAAYKAYQAQREKAKVNYDRPFDEGGDSPNDREEVAQEAVDDSNHNGTLTQNFSSDASEDNMGDLVLLSEVNVSCEPTTGETMVATKSVDAAIVWKSAHGDSRSRMMPSSTQVIDEDVGVERGPRELRHSSALHEVQGSGPEQEEERPPSFLDGPRATKQDKMTQRSQSINRSPERRQQKLQQIRRARRMLRSGLWQKPALTDRIVVQEGDHEVEIVLERETLPRKKYYEDSDSEYNATASCTDDGSTSLYGENAWIDDFDGDSRCYSITDESRSHVAGPGSYVSATGSYISATGSYISDSDDYSTEPEEIWDEITELFKLQWSDAWQAT
jgi:hypothetical protein